MDVKIQAIFPPTVNRKSFNVQNYVYYIPDVNSVLLDP